MGANDSDKYFQLIRQSSRSWLSTAQRLKLSADVLLRQTSWKQSSKSPNIFEQVAYVEGYMVLTGFAFENLLKGIDVARNPNLNVDQLYAKMWNFRGGHGISTFARRLANLSAEEIDLFERLEEYIVWVGRYAIPKSKTVFSAATEKARTIVKDSDPPIVDRLFKQFSEILVNELRKQK